MTATSTRPSTCTSVHASRAPRASCCRRARCSPVSTRTAWSGSATCSPACATCCQSSRSAHRAISPTRRCARSRTRSTTTGGPHWAPRRLRCRCPRSRRAGDQGVVLLPERGHLRAHHARAAGRRLTRPIMQAGGGSTPATAQRCAGTTAALCRAQRSVRACHSSGNSSVSSMRRRYGTPAVPPVPVLPPMMRDTVCMWRKRQCRKASSRSTSSSASS